MKYASRFLMILFYIAAGINHILQPQYYFSIMPLWLPYHAELVYISGICEISFALLLISESTRRLGGWLIILLLVAVFPANVQMMLKFQQLQHPFLWLAILRLPLQLLLLWWAYTFARKKISK